MPMPIIMFIVILGNMPRHANTSTVKLKSPPKQSRSKQRRPKDAQESTTLRQLHLKVSLISLIFYETPSAFL